MVTSAGASVVGSLLSEAGGCDNASDRDGLQGHKG
jgi:hypothetical protein